MKKFLILILFFNFSFGLDSRIENLIGQQKFNSYNKLIYKIFKNKQYNVYEILVNLKNNGLLDLFFNKARVIHTKFRFYGGDNVLNLKILNDSLISLGYYYFYFSQVDKVDDKFDVEIEFKSEHFIDPVSLIDEMKSRNCQILDVNRYQDIFSYNFDCSNGIIKSVKNLTSKNQRYINSKGVYWLKTENFKKIYIKTKKIDYYHPSIWFYDEKLNLLNNIKINKKTQKIILKIPKYCKYIKLQIIIVPRILKEE